MVICERSMLGRESLFRTPRLGMLDDNRLCGMVGTVCCRAARPMHDVAPLGDMYRVCYLTWRARVCLDRSVQAIRAEKTADNLTRDGVRYTLLDWRIIS